MRDDLSPADFMPWFILYSPEGILNGFGFVAFGKQGDLSVNKPWLEHVPAAAIQVNLDIQKIILQLKNISGYCSWCACLGAQGW